MPRIAIVVLSAFLLLVPALLFALVAGDDGDEGDSLASGSGRVCVVAGGVPGGSVAGFSGSQLEHAAAIVAAGREVDAPPRAHLVALATAMQESTLLMWANEDVPDSLNFPYERVGTDEDSVGLFQQRDSWGTIEQRMDPKTSAHLFYNALLAIPGWEEMPLTVAAQAVQISAFPDAYAQWEDNAAQVLRAVPGIVCEDQDPAAPPATYLAAAA